MNWWQATLLAVAIIAVTALSVASIPATIENYRTFDVGR